jgi:speckle-type POZ protein
MPTSASSATGDDDSGTTSTITAETTIGQHEIKVERYTQTKGGVSKFIKSVTFSVGGHGWYIRYYPDGNCDESANWISVYLYLDGAATEEDGDVKARYKFSLILDAAAAGAIPHQNRQQLLVLERRPAPPGLLPVHQSDGHGGGHERRQLSHQM